MPAAGGDDHVFMVITFLPAEGTFTKSDASVLLLGEDPDLLAVVANGGALRNHSQTSEADDLTISSHRKRWDMQRWPLTYLRYSDEIVAIGVRARILVCSPRLLDRRDVLLAQLLRVAPAGGQTHDDPLQ